MRALASWSVFGLAATLVFAGCVESTAQDAPSGDAAAPMATAGPAEFDETSGAIVGTITDAELQPIVGAQVGLLPSDVVVEPFTTFTDASGSFTLSHVPPGDHTLSAQMLGYESAARRVTVTSGAVATVSLSLEPLPSEEPYSVIDPQKVTVWGVMIKLTPQCIYDIGGTGNTLLKTCQGARPNQVIAGTPGSINSEGHYDELLSESPPWRTMLGEADWIPQSGATGRGYMFDITAPNATRGTGGSINQQSPYTFFRMQPAPPIIWRIDNPDTLLERQIAEKDWCCDWFYRVFPGYCDFGSVIGNCESTPDYGIAVESTMMVYMSFYFRAPAPEGATALPDG